MQKGMNTPSAKVGGARHGAGVSGKFVNVGSKSHSGRVVGKKGAVTKMAEAKGKTTTANA